MAIIDVLYPIATVVFVVLVTAGSKVAGSTLKNMRRMTNDFNHQLVGGASKDELSAYLTNHAHRPFGVNKKAHDRRASQAASWLNAANTVSTADFLAVILFASDIFNIDTYVRTTTKPALKGLSLKELSSMSFEDWHMRVKPLLSSWLTQEHIAERQWQG